MLVDEDSTQMLIESVAPAQQDTSIEIIVGSLVQYLIQLNTVLVHIALPALTKMLQSKQLYNFTIVWNLYWTYETHFKIKCNQANS